jgi:hypothetical protein
VTGRPEPSASESRENHDVASRLQCLAASEVEMIDSLLGQIGNYGDVRLHIESGRLASLAVTVSHDALKSGIVRHVLPHDFENLKAHGPG